MPTVRNAWVESPLQLLGALEHSALGAAGDTLVVHPRLGDAQLERSAAHVDERLRDAGAALGPWATRVGIRVDRRVMPRDAFRADGDWLVGDAYSGQVQWRLDRVEPRTLTIVDDGAITRRLAQQLHDGDPLLRPRAPRRLQRLRRELAERTTRRLRALAADGRLAVTTYLDDDDPAPALLRAIGAAVVTHRFDATRSLGMRAAAVPPGTRIVLGSAGVADGIARADAALERLAALAAASPVAYLPHRREPRWFLAAAARLRHVRVVPALLPIELALAGASHPLSIVSGPSTAVETLPAVLRGTGSTVLVDPALPGAAPLAVPGAAPRPDEAPSEVAG